VRDGLWRRAVKRVALWNFQVEVGIRRALRRTRGERPWPLGGACQRSGGCCEAPTIAVGSLVWFMPRVRRLFLAWQKHVNGFELAREDGESQAFVFRCTHFDRASRSCDSFESRPGMCRDYPNVLLWQPRPEFLPGCGYRALTPNAAGLRKALEGLDLTPEQRAKLRRGLELDAGEERRDEIER
jgi:hypothetical protein